MTPDKRVLCCVRSQVFGDCRVTEAASRRQYWSTGRVYVEGRRSTSAAVLSVLGPWTTTEEFPEVWIRAISPGSAPRWIPRPSERSTRRCTDSPRKPPTRSEASRTSWSFSAGTWTKSCWPSRLSISSSTRLSGRCFLWWESTLSKWAWIRGNVGSSSGPDRLWSFWRRHFGAVWLTGKDEVPLLFSKIHTILIALKKLRLFLWYLHIISLLNKISSLGFWFLIRP